MPTNKTPNGVGVWRRGFRQPETPVKPHSSPFVILTLNTMKEKNIL
ncbi:MAG: hypothetical protein IJM09_04785 [Neisseriaceae bacterium]|nr:hypothetical protein [Neisseriaceae bacterium]